MKPFSKFILVFILAIITALLVYAVSRLIFAVIQPSEVELQEDYLD